MSATTHVNDTVARHLSRCLSSVLSKIGAGVPLDQAFQDLRWVHELVRDGVPEDHARATVEVMKRECESAALRLCAKPRLRVATSVGGEAADDPCGVYQFRGTQGTLLYVGKAYDVARRIGQHAEDKEWWPLVARIDIETLPSERRALRHERELIIAGAPLFNIQHNLGRGLSMEQLAATLRAKV